MNDELKPYEEYKNADLLWLDKVPSHWDVKRAKNMYIKTNRPAREIDDVVTCFRDGVVTLRKNRRTTGFTESLKEIGYQGVRKGDLVIHVMDAFAGAVGVSDSDGKGTPVYSVCVSKIDLNNYYYAYIVREMAKTGFIQSLYRGIRERSSDFRFDVFANQYLPIPPRVEQDQIVKYLDLQLVKINKFIRTKKKLIAALKEQKQAVVNTAVTKGINPDVKMKPSGIEWLGDIPEHWECKKIKRFAQINPSKGDEFKKYSLNDAVVFLPMERISANGEVDCIEKRPIKEIKDGFTYFKRNDVVVAKITPCFENGKGACLDNLESDIGFGTTELIVLRAQKDILPRYLYLITRTSFFKILGADAMTGAAGQKRVPTDFISNFIIGVTSKLEQQDIVNYIYKKVCTIDESITKIEKEITLITEYRTRLISDVVTGKADVRNIVIDNTIPDNSNLSELVDEVIDDEVMDNEEGDE